MDDLYSALGVDRSASPDAIKKAYRQRAMENHPDRGGDAHAFQHVALAYRILSDEEKRKRYDAGEPPEAVDNAQSIEETARRAVIDLFLKGVDAVRPGQCVVAGMRHVINENADRFRGEIGKLDARRKRLEEAKRRMRSKSGEDFLGAAIDSLVRGVQGEVLKFQREIEIGKAILRLLDDYEWEIEKVPEQRQQGFTNELLAQMAQAQAQAWKR